MTDDVRDVLLAVCRLQVANLSPAEVMRECAVLEAFLAEQEAGGCDGVAPFPAEGERVATARVVGREVGAPLIVAEDFGADLAAPAPGLGGRTAGYGPPDPATLRATDIRRALRPIGSAVEPGEG